MHAQPNMAKQLKKAAENPANAVKTPPRVSASQKQRVVKTLQEVEPDAAFPIFVARQPIFDRKEEVYGYELLYRHSGDSPTAQFPNEDIATAQVIADGFAMAFAGLGSCHKAFINFPKNLVIQDAALALPPEIGVVELLENIAPTPDILDACARVKRKGYMLALDDYVGQEGYEELVKLADIVKVEVLGQPRDKIALLCKHLKNYDCILLAEKVETEDEYRFLLEQGFELFQGYYFSKPEIMSTTTVAPSKMAKFELLNELVRTEMDTERVGQILAGDPALSYRLLKFINSAAFSLRHNIQSIEQAIVYLGVRQLRQWLMSVVISDVDERPKIVESAFTALQRARFLHLVNEEGPHNPGLMFMLGLFSKLDTLFGQEMSVLMRDIALDNDVKEGLIGTNAELASWIAMVQDIEGANWKRAYEFISSKGLSVEHTARHWGDATMWANKCFSYACR